jgi:hypothetical protein
MMTMKARRRVVTAGGLLLVMLLTAMETTGEQVAVAVCQDPPCLPDGPGPRPPAGPSASNYVQISGTFTYDDHTAAGGELFQRPIVDMPVEVLRSTTGYFGFPTWEVVTTLRTDPTGSVNTRLWWNKSESYTLRMRPANSVVEVTDDPPRTVIELSEQRPTAGGTTLEFSHNFSGLRERGLFNVAEDIRIAASYLSARRDPAEQVADPLPPATVNVNRSFSTFYSGSAFGSVLHINNGRDLDDATILHEYGHFVEDKIGSFVAIPTSHDGCNATQILDARSPELAFMEGFADYFAQAVIAASTDAQLVQAPTEVRSGGETVRIASGTLFAATLETPPNCSKPPTLPGTAIEAWVAAALWDLADSPTTDTDHDPATGHALDILSIVDGELDRKQGAGDVDFDDFANAWTARGLSPSDLIDARNRNQVTSATDTGATDLPINPPDDSVCHLKRWTPGC